MKTLKLQQYLSILTFLLLGTASQAENIVSNQTININNLVEECFQINPINIVNHNNLILFDVTLVAHKSTGYCGCKSANLSYYISSIKSDGQKKAGEYGKFSSLNNGKYSFILEKNNTQKNEAYVLSIQCASPD